MSKVRKPVIMVETVIRSSARDVWQFWIGIEHIVKWNNASDDWHTPWAENDLRPGGRFLYRMEAKNGKYGFDLSGVYKKVEPEKTIEYILDDGRSVKVSFFSENKITTVRETFEAENENPVDMQKAGWQAILDNFKRYAEKPDI